MGGGYRRLGVDAIEGRFGRRQRGQRRQGRQGVEAKREGQWLKMLRKTFICPAIKNVEGYYNHPIELSYNKRISHRIP